MFGFKMISVYWCTMSIMYSVYYCGSNTSSLYDQYPFRLFPWEIIAGKQGHLNNIFAILIEFRSFVEVFNV